MPGYGKTNRKKGKKSSYVNPKIYNPAVRRGRGIESAEGYVKSLSKDTGSTMFHKAPKGK